ncbi:D-2-hydroxyacid dehydrogenase [candidate division KSB1 bacterium]|nr:MAG: D-2-hydroxyacid dehydrogenase [candidate division KSB1 bacterium]
MNRLKILVAVTKNEKRRGKLRNTIEEVAYKNNKEINILFCKQQDIKDFIFDCDVALCFVFEKESLERANKLKWIHFASVGIDHTLYPELLHSDIILTTSRGINNHNVAEHSFAFMLYFARCIDKAIEFKVKRKWEKWNFSVQTSTLRGKILGILGLGAIGTEIAKLGKAFGMKIYGMDRDTGKKTFVDVFFKKEELKNIIKIMDYIVLSLPLTEETFHILGKEELDLLKPDSVLINIARGKLIDEEYLIKVLKEGKIKGFGTDVYYNEPLPEDSELFDLPNVVMTPHIGGNFEGYIDEVGKSFSENLQLFFTGKPLKNVVDRELGF